MAGYHLYDIPRGVMGEYSKVTEEFMEFNDALSQDCSIMAVLELADLVGSMKYYFFQQQRDYLWTKYIATLLLKEKYLTMDAADLELSFKQTLVPDSSKHWHQIYIFLDELDSYVRQFNFTLKDLITMSAITERAFINGYRS